MCSHQGSGEPSVTTRARRPLAFLRQAQRMVEDASDFGFRVENRTLQKQHDAEWAVRVIEVLAHLDRDPQPLSAEIRGRLVPGGVFVGATPAPEKYEEDVPVERLEDMAQRSKEVETVHAHVHLYSEVAGHGPMFIACWGRGHLVPIKLRWRHSLGVVMAHDQRRPS